MYFRKMSIRQIINSDNEYFEQFGKIKYIVAFLYKYFFESETAARILNRFSHNMKWYKVGIFGLEITFKLADTYIREMYISIRNKTLFCM